MRPESRMLGVRELRVPWWSRKIFLVHRAGIRSRNLARRLEMRHAVSSAETGTRTVTSNVIIHPHLCLHLVFVVHSVFVKVPIFVLLIIVRRALLRSLRACYTAMLVLECSLLCSTPI
jgi:hypothetical protein